MRSWGNRPVEITFSGMIFCSLCQIALPRLVDRSYRYGVKKMHGTTLNDKRLFPNVILCGFG